MTAGSRAAIHFTRAPGVLTDKSQPWDISGYFRRERTLQGDMDFICRGWNCTEFCLNWNTRPTYNSPPLHSKGLTEVKVQRPPCPLRVSSFVLWKDNLALHVTESKILPNSPDRHCNITSVSIPVNVILWHCRLILSYITKFKHVLLHTKK